VNAEAEVPVSAVTRTPIALPMADERPRERGDAAANRRRILEAARALLSDPGADDLTMDALACAAAVGKGTIFRRFGDRAGLAEALVDDDMRDLQDRLLHGPPPLGPGAPAAERLEAFVTELLRHYVENLPIALLAAAELEGRGTLLGALRLHVRILVHEIDPRLDAEVIAGMILGAIAPAVINDLSERGTDRAELEASALALLRGLTRRPRRSRART
jgi:AcrR family transcriptional regulator